LPLISGHRSRRRHHRAPPAAYVPAITPVYNWGGIYFGFNLGYGFGTSNWTDPNDPGGETGNFNLRGFLVGPTLGFNFQTDAFVIGAEAILTARGSMAK
jgi:outer membrane immunogenic protein